MHQILKSRGSSFQRSWLSHCLYKICATRTGPFSQLIFCCFLFCPQLLRTRRFRRASCRRRSWCVRGWLASRADWRGSRRPAGASVSAATGPSSPRNNWRPSRQRSTRLTIQTCSFERNLPWRLTWKKRGLRWVKFCLVTAENVNFECLSWKKVSHERNTH